MDNKQEDFKEIEINLDEEESHVQADNSHL